MERAMGIEPTSEAWEALSDCRERSFRRELISERQAKCLRTRDAIRAYDWNQAVSASIPPSSRSSQPLESNGQTFGPLRSPGTTRSRYRLFAKEIHFTVSNIAPALPPQ